MDDFNFEIFGRLNAFLHIRVISILLGVSNIQQTFRER